MKRTAAVIVTYNRKAMLQRCLRALCTQTAGVPELWVIDNASTDGTAELVAQLNLPTMHYYNTGKNLGGAGGFACGIGGAVFIAVPGVHFQFNAHLTDGPGLDGLGEAGVTLQLQRRQAVELCSRPEAFGPVDGQQLKIRIGHGNQMLFFHKLLI